MEQIINLIAFLLVIIGAINWGLVGVSGFDLVTYITPDYPQIEKIIKILVGIAGIYVAYILYQHRMSGNKKETTKPPAVLAAAKTVVA